MTGAFAVVLAALGAARVEAAPVDRHRGSCLSRYDVAQTVQRLEASARQRGLGVFLKMTLEDPGSRVLAPLDAGRRARGAGLVVVLESSRGGTPVVMRGDGDDPAAALELPLRLEVRPHGPQSSRVWIPPALDDTLALLPGGLADDLAALPRLVADALG